MALKRTRRAGTMAASLLLGMACSLPAHSRVCDANGDGSVDHQDLQLITSALGSTLSADDPRDANGDGAATRRDLRRCAKLCALPACASTIPNEPPAIISAPRMDTVEETLYSYRVRARDSDRGDRLEYRLHHAPVGMAIDVHSGIITWVPSSTQTGANAVEIEVSDGRGGFAGQVYSVHVEAAGTQRPRARIAQAVLQSRAVDSGSFSGDVPL